VIAGALGFQRGMRWENVECGGKTWNVAWNAAVIEDLAALTK